MCIRFDIDTGEMIKWSRALKAWIPEMDWAMGLDLFPGYVAPVVRPDWSKKTRDLVEAQWGMTPFWAKKPNWGKLNAYNARSETVFEKPTFRTAIKKRRCVVPASGFFERDLDAGRWKRFAANEGVLALAGLYEPSNEHCPLDTFALVTTDPNEQVAAMHDRMPVILSPEGVEAWLDEQTSMDDLRALFVPCPEDWTHIEDAGPIKRKAATIPEE